MGIASGEAHRLALLCTTNAPSVGWTHAVVAGEGEAVEVAPEAARVAAVCCKYASISSTAKARVARLSSTSSTCNAGVCVCVSLCVRACMHVHVRVCVHVPFTSST